MARAKIWLAGMNFPELRVDLKVGQDVTLGVVSTGGRLAVSTWGPRTTIHGRVVGIEWHERTSAGYGPGVRVNSTDDDVPEAHDDAFELTVATNGWLPHR